MKKYRVKDTSYINGAMVGANTIVEMPDDFTPGSNLELVNDGGTTAAPLQPKPADLVYDEVPVVSSEAPDAGDAGEPITPVEE